MARRRNPLVQALFRAASIGFVRFTQVLPLGVARMLGRRLGDLAYLLVPRIRRIGLANLDWAYGDALTPAEKRAILREATRNVGIVAAEFGRIPLLGTPAAADWVEVEGLAQIGQGQGVVLIGAHLANWEWMAPLITALGIPGAEIVRPLDDPALNEFVDGLRRSTGLVTIPKHGAGVEVLRLLGEHSAVGLLVDQNPRHNAAPAQFFGIDTWATTGAALLGIRAEAPVHPIQMVRLPDDRYRLTILPAIEMVRGDDLRQDLLENTQRCQDAIEAMIREHPGQWLWLHDRWKPRPRLAEAWAKRLGETE